MKDGFIKVAAATPDIEVGNTAFNTEHILSCMQQAQKEHVKLLVFPELCISGYTCNDLFLQDILLDGCLAGLEQIRSASAAMDMVIVAGLPFLLHARLYNVAAVLFRGRLLGLVPKQHIPNYSEFYEARHFAPAPADNEHVNIPVLGAHGHQIPFGAKLLFAAEDLPDFVLGIDICEDLWMPVPPSCYHAMASATVIANLSASDETTGKEAYRRQLVSNQSARLICGYIYADAGEGESSTDLVFAGHNLIAENGSILAQSERFHNETTISELDLGRLVSERRRMGTFTIPPPAQAGYEVCSFSFGQPEETTLTRFYSRTPFVPSVKEDRDRRCNEIFNIQAMGLKKRLAHTHCKSAVIGISGGLDSTLALLVTVRAFDLLGLDRSGIRAITMPCFGTTDRTYHNALDLMTSLGVSQREIPIHNAVRQHFADIGHDESDHSVTYENCQARERTQVLMDVANKIGAIVLGTGDLSEIALGWCTYNADHMSMYGVNSGVPKTLVRWVIQTAAENEAFSSSRECLQSILDTPISPELLPPDEKGNILQQTEDVVGPYALHDFFLYYAIRFGYPPKKVFELCCIAFQDDFSCETILKWLKNFYRRFWTQQFKRNCMPDGVKIGSIALSPRGDWRMPSDAQYKAWMDECDCIKA